MHSVLFNCCTDYAAPDWRQFNWLEIGGCITVTDEHGDTFTEGGIDHDEAEFFTVYGHLIDGGLEAITDCPTHAAAVAAAEHMRALSGLPVHS